MISVVTQGLACNLKLHKLCWFRFKVAHKKDSFGLCLVVHVYPFIQPGQSNVEARTRDKSHDKEANHVQGEAAIRYLCSSL